MGLVDHLVQMHSFSGYCLNFFEVFVPDIPQDSNGVQHHQRSWENEFFSSCIQMKIQSNGGLFPIHQQLA